MHFTQFSFRNSLTLYFIYSALPHASLEQVHILMNHRREHEERSDEVLDLEKRMDMALPVETIAYIKGKSQGEY